MHECGRRGRLGRLERGRALAVYSSSQKYSIWGSCCCSVERSILALGRRGARSEGQLGPQPHSRSRHHRRDITAPLNCSSGAVVALGSLALRAGCPGLAAVGRKLLEFKAGSLDRTHGRVGLARTRGSPCEAASGVQRGQRTDRACSASALASPRAAWLPSCEGASTCWALHAARARHSSSETPACGQCCSATSRARSGGGAGQRRRVPDPACRSDAEDLLLGCHVLASIPPVPGDCPDPVLEAHAGAFRRAASSLSWVAYLSTTSVYGDADGAEVDEQCVGGVEFAAFGLFARPRVMLSGCRSPVDASSPKAASRLRAEAAWLALHEEYGVPVHVFRLGGAAGADARAAQ